MKDTYPNHILRVQCVDKPGVVAAVATCLSNAECNIEESAQFNDQLSGQFFMRVVMKPLNENALVMFKGAFADIAQTFDMNWKVSPKSEAVKAMILVSKADHCLNDLLYRWRTNHLNIDITGVVSNHEAVRELVEQRGLAFHHMPVDDKEAQEQKLADLVEETKTELIVLARYMQILSDDFCRKYPQRIINIHHSFLPSFKGAKPYHQAHERGVKIIGATAHYATADLDEGPIIEQDIVRISHADNPRTLQILGRDTESKVLARAIKLYTERRIFMHGQRTVIL